MRENASAGVPKPKASKRNASTPPQGIPTHEVPKESTQLSEKEKSTKKSRRMDNSVRVTF